MFKTNSQIIRQLDLSRILFTILMTGAVIVALPGDLRADAALLKTADKQIAGKKYKAAARTITKAMNSGSLSDAEMAQALYRRGVAYNSAKRHSSAIADLTGAIWLGKLKKAVRQDAYRQRAIAYQATGHKKLARGDLARSGTNTASLQPVRKKPAIVKAAPAIPTFNTVVRPAKKPAKPKRTKTASKPVTPEKPAIPAFRTSIATE